jgi:hypothetical protein
LVSHVKEEYQLRVFKDRVLGGIFGPKRDEVTGQWRKLHNEELHSLYSSPSIVRVIKSRRMRWSGHVARMGRGEMRTKVWLGNLKGRDHSEDIGVGRRIILKWISGKLGWRVWIGFT